MNSRQCVVSSIFQQPLPQQSFIENSRTLFIDCYTNIKVKLQFHINAYHFRHEKHEQYFRFTAIYSFKFIIDFRGIMETVTDKFTSRSFPQKFIIFKFILKYFVLFHS